MIKLVLIDFDDTLCLTEKACFKIESLIAQKMGFPPMTREAHLANWGKPVKEAITKRVPGIDADIFMQELEKTWPDFINRGELDAITDSNLEVLAKMRNNGIKTAILTSRTFLEVKHLLNKNHPLSSKIDAFYHKDNNEFYKPNPKVYNKPLREFGVEPDETVYVGDSVSDAISAKEAGLHFIAVLESGQRRKEDFAAVPVDYFASTFQDILSYLGK